MRELKKQLYTPGDPWYFGSRYTDVKTMALEYRGFFGKKKKGGLAATMENLGLKFEGTQHWACDDAANTYEVFLELKRRARTVFVASKTYYGELNTEYELLGLHTNIKAARARILKETDGRKISWVNSTTGREIIDGTLTIYYEVSKMEVQDELS
jgi:inhibitor of KinA sporulation pathway (predicted exonuclease)